MDNTKMLNAQTNAGAGVLAGEELARKVAELTATVHREEGFKPFRVKADGSIETLEGLRSIQPFRKGQVIFYEGLSFGRFVNRFKNPTTVLFADSVGKSFTAALDYHPGLPDQTSASWDLFRGILPLRHTESWKTWTAANKEPMTQAEFAQFLEDNIPDIADPSGAKLVEIARSLEAKTDVNYSSHIREEDGSHRFNYSEQVNGTAAGGVTIPAEITLVLQPFEGSKTYPIKARFRYRVNAKQVAMWFDLVRMQDVLTAAFDDELLKIDGEVNGPPADGAGAARTPIYNGPAPTAQQPKD